MSRTSKKLKDYDVKSSGKRIRDLAKRNHMSSANVAELLGYKNDKSVYPIYRGDQALTKKQLEILADKFKCREEYIQAVDDWETDEKFEKEAAERDNKSFKAARGYLIKIGIHNKFYCASRCGVRTLYIIHLNDCKKYLTFDTLKRIEASFDFSLSYDKFMEKYKKRKDITIYWRTSPENISIPDNIQFSYHDDIGMTTQIPDVIIPKTGQRLLLCNLSYEFGFHIFKDDKLLFDLSIGQFQAMLRKIEALVTCFVENYNI